MTQAILNNLIKPVTSTMGEAKSFADNGFQSLLNKQTDLQKTAQTVQDTIGAMKKPVKNALSDFTNKLQEVAKEVGEENSLDLTLAKDVEEIIDNINTDAEETAQVDESAEDTTITDEENSTLIDETKAAQNSAVQTVIQTVVPELTQQLESLEGDSEELTVTLNGRDINDFLKDFGLNNEEDETLLIKPAESDEVADAEGKTLEDLVDEDVLRELNVESVEADASDSGNSSDLMQNQTAEEQGVKAMLHVNSDSSEFKVEAKPNVSLQNVKPTGSNDVTPSKIIEQISKQLENMNSGSKVNIVLNPESLGKVSVQLINTKEGLSAQFTVVTQEARNLIMKGLDGLKDTLAAQGVSIDNVSVKLKETQDGEYNADWTEQEGSRGGNKEQGSRRGQKEKEQFEEMMSFAQNEEN